jgi:hypothetical protein
VRDEHVVHREGRPDARGESIYLCDAAAGQLQYLHIESAGGYSRATVSADAQALVFPATTYRADGHTQLYRARWQRAGSDAYDVLTEFQEKGRWLPGFTVHMQRIAN